MSAVRDDARPVVVTDPPLGCFFGVHAATREPGEDFARCACNRPDDTGRVPRPYAGSDVRCGTCAAAGVFRWQDTCEAIGHDARAVEDDDDAGEDPDTCLAPDGHWYVITYGRARWEIHARDCETCEDEARAGAR